MVGLFLFITGVFDVFGGLLRASVRLTLLFCRLTKLLAGLLVMFGELAEEDDK